MPTARHWTPVRTVHSIAATVCVTAAAATIGAAYLTTASDWLILAGLTVTAAAAETIRRTAGR